MKVLARLALVVATLYAAVVGTMVLREAHLVYHPYERSVARPPSEFALSVRDVSFGASDGTQLTGWIIPAARADSSGMWLLICHGNFGNIGYGQRPQFYAFMRDLGVNLL